MVSFTKEKFICELGVFPSIRRSYEMQYLPLPGILGLGSGASLD